MQPVAFPGTTWHSLAQRGRSLRARFAAIDDIEPKKLKALAMFIDGANVRQVGSALGVSHTTAWNWLNEPTMQAALEEHRQATIDAVRRSLVNSAQKAASVLLEVMDSDDDGRRLQAANSVLDRTGIKGADEVHHTGAILHGVIEPRDTTLSSLAETTDKALEANAGDLNVQENQED